PVFSMDRDLYLALSQSLNADFFASFTVAPDSKGYRALLDTLPASDDQDVDPAHPVVLGRMSAGSRLFIHRLARGVLMDSVEGVDGSETMKMLAWTMFGLHGGGEGPPPSVHLFHSPDETPPAPSRKTGLSYVVHRMDKPLVHYFAQSLLDIDRLSGFASSLRLKRRQMPKSLWIVIVILALYGSFAFMQLRERAELAGELTQLTERLQTLRKKWEPIQARQDKVQSMLDQEKALMERDPDTLSALKLLTVLTEKTPQDTYLKQVFLKERKLEITGESGDALQYRSMLSTIEGFEDVQFASTVHHLAQENKDRFVIKATLNPLKLREQN
ncbi:MAG: PilN domain-containing protein, partial [Spirochaetota bacterium]